MAEPKEKKCRGCGKDVFVIKSGGFYGRVLAEAEPVWIRQESGGESFITIEGRVIFGHIAGDAEDDPDVNLIPAYIPHKGRCPGNCRAPRHRNRPSGYR